MLTLLSQGAGLIETTAKEMICKGTTWLESSTSSGSYSREWNYSPLNEQARVNHVHLIEERSIRVVIQISQLGEICTGDFRMNDR